MDEQTWTDARGVTWKVEGVDYWNPYEQKRDMSLELWSRFSDDGDWIYAATVSGIIDYAQALVELGVVKKMSGGEDAGSAGAQ
jgi:hypothetical protein